MKAAWFKHKLARTAFYLTVGYEKCEQNVWVFFIIIIYYLFIYLNNNNNAYVNPRYSTIFYTTGKQTEEKEFMGKTARMKHTR